MIPVVKERVLLVCRSFSHLVKLSIDSINSALHAYGGSCSCTTKLSWYELSLSLFFRSWDPGVANYESVFKALLIFIVCFAQGAAPSSESRCELQDWFFPDCVAKGSWFGGCFQMFGAAVAATCSLTATYSTASCPMCKLMSRLWSWPD